MNPNNSPLKTGTELIAEERERQKKRWSESHDDSHDKGEIAEAAYMILHDVVEGPGCTDGAEEDDEDATWMENLAVHVRNKYGDNHVRRLTIAGAMIAAEIDRLNRSGAPEFEDGWKNVL